MEFAIGPCCLQAYCFHCGWQILIISQMQYVYPLVSFLVSLAAPYDTLHQVLQLSAERFQHALQEDRK